MATNRRERELARKRYERQQARRIAAQRRRRRRTALIAGITVVVLAVAGGLALALGGGSSSKPSTLAAASTATPTPTATATPTASVPASATPSATASATASASTSASPAADTRPLACYTKKAPTPPAATKYSTEPPLTVDASKTYTMKIYFNCGVVTAALDVKDAPHAVNSFDFLASKGFFNGDECHRVTTSPSFSVLQCGDPTATGTGGPGYTFKDENLAGAKYTRGTLAMANSGANTNGSQFFLVDKDSSLPANYTVFGHITSGIGVLDRIIAAGVAGGGTDGKPAKRVFMNSMNVTAS